MMQIVRRGRFRDIDPLRAAKRARGKARGISLMPGHVKGIAAAFLNLQQLM